MSPCAHIIQTSAYKYTFSIHIRICSAGGNKSKSQLSLGVFLRRRKKFRASKFLFGKWFHRRRRCAVKTQFSFSPCASKIIKIPAQILTLDWENARITKVHVSAGGLKYKNPRAGGARGRIYIFRIVYSRRCNGLGCWVGGRETWKTKPVYIGPFFLIEPQPPIVRQGRQLSKLNFLGLPRRSKFQLIGHFRIFGQQLTELIVSICIISQAHKIYLDEYFNWSYHGAY